MEKKFTITKHPGAEPVQYEGFGSGGGRYCAREVELIHRKLAEEAWKSEGRTNFYARCSRLHNLRDVTDPKTNEDGR